MPEGTWTTIETPWSRSPQQLLDALGVSRERGLSAPEIAHRRRSVGWNRLREPHHTGVWEVVANQFKSLVPLLLVVALAVSLAMGDVGEAVAIAVVIVINASIGFATEWHATRSMEALRRMERVNARVRRDGEVRALPAQELVPGDLVLVEGGDVVTADVRLVEASRLQTDESLLTGESMPIGKQIDPLDIQTGVADRTNMLFKGTLSRRSRITAHPDRTGAWSFPSPRRTTR